MGGGRRGGGSKRGATAQGAVNGEKNVGGETAAQRVWSLPSPIGAFDEMIITSDPAAVKALGRNVFPFEEVIWERVVCTVAVEAIYQKFSQNKGIRGELLETGDRLIAEATTNDRVWGIGLNVGDRRCQDPSQWKGSNLLGWALMEARGRLLQGRKKRPGKEDEQARCCQLHPGGQLHLRRRSSAAPKRAKG